MKLKKSLAENLLEAIAYIIIYYIHKKHSYVHICNYIHTYVHMCVHMYVRTYNYSSVLLLKYTIQQVLSVRPNFCEASISLPSRNICDYYIRKAILLLNYVIS